MLEDDLTRHYHLRRRTESLESIADAIDEAVDDDDIEPDRYTIVLLPGGMGSELERSRNPYRTMGGSLGGYGDVWIDAGIFDHDLRLMPIDPRGYDEGLHIIRAEGFLSVLGVSPYDGTRKYFRDGGFNFLTCAFDWRRTLRECAELVHEFLLMFQNAVKDKFGVDPLPKTTLVGHSQGGMVAKSFLDLLVEEIDPRDISDHIHRVISVGTGFYGVNEHLERLYKGQRFLNFIYKPEVVAEISASLLAPYTFMFIDHDLFDRDAEALGLERYPHRDADTPAAADPYDSDNFARYPAWVRRSELGRAKEVRYRLTMKLPSPVRERVFHIWSNSEQTPVELLWTNVDGSEWDTSSPTPVSPVYGSGDKNGDGGVPWWSAALADTPEENVRVLQFGGEHIKLMEYEETLDLIAELVTGVEIQRESNQRVFLGRERESDEAEVERFLTEEVYRSGLNEDQRRRIWLRLFEEFALD